MTKENRASAERKERSAEGKGSLWMLLLLSLCCIEAVMKRGSHMQNNDSDRIKNDSRLNRVKG